MTARQFPGRPESVAAARSFVRDALRARPREVVETAELMASELATNCVLHARSDFALVIHHRGEIRVEVTDSDGAGRPVVRSPAPDERTGRGLRIVDAMSDEWGIDRSVAGKTVWFVLGRDRPAAEVASAATPGARARR